MKKQLLGLVVIACTMNVSCDNKTHEKSEIELIKEQNELLKKSLNELSDFLRQAQHEKKQAKQEQTHRQIMAQQAQQSVVIPAILSLSNPQCNLEYPSFPLANKANIFYDAPLNLSEVAVILSLHKFLIEAGSVYLWPTMRAIILTQVANKIVTTACNAADNITDNISGIRPCEMLSVLTPEEQLKNQILRSPNIAPLINEMKKLQKEVMPIELREKLLRQINELKDLQRQQETARNSRADSGIPAYANTDQNNSVPNANPMSDDVD